MRRAAAFCCLLLAGLVTHAGANPSGIHPLSRPEAQVVETPGNRCLPAPRTARNEIRFIPNNLRTHDPTVRYYAKTRVGTIFLTDDGITYSLQSSDGKEARGWALRETLLDARRVSPEGVKASRTVVNLFRGNDPTQWERGIPTFEEVAYGEIYPGITLTLRPCGRTIEKVFTVERQGDPGAISVRVEGGSGIRITAAGELEVDTGIGSVRFAAPAAYQEIRGRKVPVPVSYRLSALDATYRFEVGSYDRSYPLVIDPSLLGSTFLAGTDSDSGQAVALARDGTQDIYVAGITYSDDFPTTLGAVRTSRSGGRDVFVSRFSLELDTLLASTYLGGAGYDTPRQIAVDSSGNVFVAGLTESSNFPTTEGAYDRACGEEGECGDTDGFVARLSANLDALQASTYIGGWAYDDVNGLVVLSQGVYLAGNTRSEFGSFLDLPAGGYDTTYSSWGDVYIARLNPDLAAVTAFTFLGGEGEEAPYSMALDTSGNVYVAGWADWGFPTTPGAYDTSYAGGKEGFVARFSGDLSQLLASTYLGGTGDGSEEIRAVALDASGNVVVAGWTESSSFPKTTGAFDSSHNGSVDAFVAKLSSDLSTLLVSTLVGGTDEDTALGLTLDSTGNILITGYTLSDNFPVTIDAYRSRRTGSDDVFISKLNPDLTKLLYSTYLGGTEEDQPGRVAALALGPDDTFVVTGYTYSTDWPTSEGAYDPVGKADHWGYCDAFVARLAIPEYLYANVWGPGILAPGAQGDFIVRYKNGMKSTARDVVLLVDLPIYLQYVSSIPAGVFYAKPASGNLVFWRLGDLEAGSEGEVTLKVEVPWGTPAGGTSIYALIGAVNYPESPFTLSDYLNYTPLEVTSWTFLSANQVQALLAANPAMKELFDHAKGQGYLFFNTGTSAVMSDGSVVYRLILFEPEKGGAAPLTYVGGKAFIEVPRRDQYTFFTLDEGFKRDMKLGTFQYWQAADQSSPADSVLKEIAVGPLAYVNPEGCVWNCTLMQALDVAMGVVSKKYAMVSKGIDCYACAQSILRGNPDFGECDQCGDGVERAITAIYKEIPGIGQVTELGENVIGCIDQCKENPEKYFCTGDTHICSDYLGKSGVSTYRCDTETGRWSFYPERIACDRGEIGPCRNSKACSSSDPAWKLSSCCPDLQGEDLLMCEIARRSNVPAQAPVAKTPPGKDAKPGRMRAAIEPRRAVSSPYPSCGAFRFEMRVAHDPNAKSADLKGEVLGGNRILYTIEYENTGGATAYSVFVLDTLPQELDEDTLEIHNDGSYSRGARMLSWLVGDLAAKAQGKVTFSVQAKGDLADGTTITNYAEVHFPSADEITPTNPVVHVVRTLTAEPQVVEALAGVPLAVTLSGQGAGDFSYQLVSQPLYGTLTGAAPVLTYTAGVDFSGVDAFQFVTVSGSSRSNPAEVRINVGPNPADTTPPKITETFPRNKASGVLFSSTPVAEVYYSPFLEVVFSEALDPQTVTTESFTVGGVTGDVTYDEAQNRALFMPQEPLSPVTLYTATIGPGITDLMGNPMSDPYTWTFTTSGTASIKVILPGGAADMNFGSVAIGASDTQPVSIQNWGTENLEIAGISVGGTNPGDFAITENSCSGTAVGPQGSCSTQVVFKPLIGGTRQATVVIASNDPLKPSVKIPVQGAATGGIADLKGRWKSVKQTCTATGCSLKCVFLEQNPGTLNAGASSTWFYLSKDKRVNAGDKILKKVSVKGLPAKGSKQITFTAALSKSAKGLYVIAVTDAAGKVPESLENNNKAVFGPIR